MPIDLVKPVLDAVAQGARGGADGEPEPTPTPALETGEAAALPTPALGSPARKKS
jgi:hypothetical protein